MKKGTRPFLALLLLIALMFSFVPPAAAEKKNESRAIAIVFDNSGSMYENGDKAWCRATYAMEVFASMLNAGDVLEIYPMHPITVGGKKYTMEAPLRVSSASQASEIREIFTDAAGGTPIESVDCAIRGLQQLRADKKYLIVLTDGEAFHMNGTELSRKETQKQLDSRFQEHAGKDMNVMYLGIGTKVVMPGTPQSEYFVKKQAKNSGDVLAALTEMCNQVFGRDTMPKNHLSGKSLDFDISMKKLIVFVQGENVTDLKVTGPSGEVGSRQGTASMMYSTNGCGNVRSVPDTSLQGMMVTYGACSAGSYTIEYSGNATSVEVYYEPEADLDFVFTDSAGSLVEPSELYEGDYKVSFGMVDSKTRRLIQSDLLGNPHYQGSISVNGQKTTFSQDGMSGEVPVALKMNDSFDADLTVTFLSGYTITKDSRDFGWPEGGIKVAPRPAGDLRLEISGGASSYSLQELENGAPFILKVFHQEVQLTGEELEKVKLSWDPSQSNAELRSVFQNDHYEISLHYPDPSNPAGTAVGESRVTVSAQYAAKGSDTSGAQATLTYAIQDDYAPLKLEFRVPQDYILISAIEDTPPITVQLSLNGQPIPQEDFEAVALSADCGGINFELVPNALGSCYQIKLLDTSGLAEGDYQVLVSATYADHIGRASQASDGVVLTLSNTPLWLKWAIRILALLLLILITVLILRIRLVPKKARVTKRDSKFVLDGEDKTQNTSLDLKIDKSTLTISSKYAGTKSGVTMQIRPGKESFLMKPHQRRYVEVVPSSVRKTGGATIQEVTLGSMKYRLNDETNKLESVRKVTKPFELKNNSRISYSGTMMSAGMQGSFSFSTKLNCKKK